MSQISLQKIAKTFGDTPVLNSVSLDIDEGEFITLVGPSGCGKSTLLRILAGLEAADSGQVEIQGQDVSNIRPADRNLAMVFQSYALYPHLNVAQNMMTPLRMRDLGRFGRLPIIGPFVARSAHQRMRDHVGEVAKTLQIAQLLDRKPGQLSGGQRQRVALGRAMVRQPVAFLMDEPLSNLDAALRVHMRAELSELHRRLATTFVYVTHDQAEALTMSDRMAVMMHGDILQVGPPNDIYLNPVSLDVARFIGSPQINMLPGELNSTGALELLGVAAEVRSNLTHQAITVGLRPEHLAVRAQGRFAGQVRHSENLGSDIFLHLEVDGALAPVVIRLAPSEAVGVSLGERISFDFDTRNMLLFASDGSRIPAIHSAREVA